jgi:F-type H+-transporting ATPase subunit delta
MAELITVARPYAQATFRTALETGDLAGWSGMLQLAAAIVDNTQMSALLANPKVSTGEKVGLFHSVTAGKLNDAMKNLVNLLIEDHRAGLLVPISVQFESLKREHDKVLKAHIVSAFPLSDAEKSDLVGVLAKKYGKTVEAEVSVDSSLIGGVRIQIGDEVIHASARDTLDHMAVALSY